MTWQRTIGIDLAVKGNHVAAGCDHRGDFIRKKPFRFKQTLAGYESLIQAFVKPDMKPEEVLFVMEATGNVWLSLSSFLIARGFKVCTVKTQQSSDLRKFFKKYTKSDFNDAKSLAKQPFIDRNDMNELILPTRDIYTLRRLSKQHAKYGDDISRCKNRIHAIFQLTNPQLIDSLGDNKFTQGAVFFYENMANPLKVKKMGFSRFQKAMRKNFHGNADPKVIEQMYEASINHCRLLEDIESRMGESPFDLKVLQQEVKRELRHIRFMVKEQRKLQKAIDVLRKKLDPDDVLLDLPGIGETIAPVVLAMIGQCEKFPNLNKLKAYLGFVPRKKQSSGTDRKGLRITKNGQNIFKEHIYLAAEIARQWDVEFAHKYHTLINRGKHHKQAICALGNMLMARIYSIMKRRARAMASGDIRLAQSIRYQFRDLNGNPITKAQAREIILKNYPSKKQQKKEKALLAFSTRQSKDSSKSQIEPPSPRSTNDILSAI